MIDNLNLQFIHFKNPELLLLILLIPFLIAISYYCLNYSQKSSLLEFFDKEKLDILYQKKSNYKYITILKVIFFLLLFIAIAGPRWDYQEITLKKQSKNILILLDVSKSMNAIDLKPNRFTHAKRSMLQIINQEQASNIGLVAFGKNSYNLIPFTTDQNYIKEFISNLELNNFNNEGTNINLSLNLIKEIHDINPIDTVYIVSDYDFDENIDNDKLDFLFENNILVKTKKTSTDLGSPIKDFNGDFIYNANNQTVISKPLNSIIESLNINNNDIIEFRNEKNIILTKEVKIWEEEFYLLVIPLIIIFFLLNKNSAFLILFLILNFILIQPNVTYANPFLNYDQNALKKFNDKEFEEAEKLFTTDYNKGVSAYKNKNYQNAIKYFSSNNDLKSQFNLGNSQLLNQEIDAAIDTYEKILAHHPKDSKTIKNLAIARQIQQQQQENNQNNNDDKKTQDQTKNKQSDSEKNSNIIPRISKQDKNLAGNIDKINQNSLQNLIDKSKEKSFTGYNSNNPW